MSARPRVWVCARVVVGSVRCMMQSMHASSPLPLTEDAVATAPAIDAGEERSAGRDQPAAARKPQSRAAHGAIAAGRPGRDDPKKKRASVTATTTNKRCGGMSPMSLKLFTEMSVRVQSLGSCTVIEAVDAPQGKGGRGGGKGVEAVLSGSRTLDRSIGP